MTAPRGPWSQEIQEEIAGAGVSYNFADGEKPAGLIDGSNALFTLQNSPAPASSLKLYKNGMRLEAGSDFTLSGNSITYLPGQVPKVGDSHLADYRY